MTGTLAGILGLISDGILVYFFAINSLYALFIVLSVIGIIRHSTQLKYVTLKDMFAQPLVKPVSVIAPAHNEEATVVDNVRSLLGLEYPVFEIIIVNDGSSDQTLQRLIDAFHFKKTKRVFRKIIPTKPVRGIYLSPVAPRLVLVDKENGRKADALNAGLNVSRYPLFCAIDCDSVIDRDALLKMARPFHEDPERTIGVGGVVRLSNDCLIKNGQIEKVNMPRSWLARIQIVEYLRAFLGSRLGLSKIGSLLIISGAFGMFRKDVVLECGGYDHKAIGEDMELVVRLTRKMRERKSKFRIRFIPDTLCWTEAPESWKILKSQRNRWQRGLIQVLQAHRKMLFNPRAGVTGLFALPFYFVFEMLSPLIELSGYLILVYFVATDGLNSPFAVKLFFLAIVAGMFLSLSAILLEEYAEKKFPRFKDVLILFASGLAENLGYRQVIAYVRAKSFLDLIKGKTGWGQMQRKGFATEKKKA